MTTTASQSPNLASQLPEDPHFPDKNMRMTIQDGIITLLRILGSESTRDALIAGYAEERPWDRHDEAILPLLVTARKLAMLGWLQSRSENPRLRAYLPKAVEYAVRHLRSL